MMVYREPGTRRLSDFNVIQAMREPGLGFVFKERMAGYATLGATQNTEP